MGLIYVTGLSGSGKSAVMRELKARGYETHGVDEEGYADWIDRKTGQTIAFPEDEASVDIHDWYQDHDWVLSKARIEGLHRKAEASKEPVFLAGVAGGDNLVWHLFQAVLVLAVDEHTMKKRITSRKDNQFGKHPDEMAELLKWLDGYEDRYRSCGATIIDATRSLSEVVDDVVNQAGNYQSQSDSET